MLTLQDLKTTKAEEICFSFFIQTDKDPDVAFNIGMLLWSEFIMNVGMAEAVKPLFDAVKGHFQWFSDVSIHGLWINPAVDPSSGYYMLHSEGLVTPTPKLSPYCRALANNAFANILVDISKEAGQLDPAAAIVLPGMDRKSYTLSLSDTALLETLKETTLGVIGPFTIPDRDIMHCKARGVVGPVVPQE